MSLADTWRQLEISVKNLYSYWFHWTCSKTVSFPSSVCRQPFGWSFEIRRRNFDNWIWVIDFSNQLPYFTSVQLSKSSPLQFDV